LNAGGRRLRYHIDTDMGVDDGLALLLADRVLDRVCAISTVAGNVSLEIATRNALLFRALLGRARTWPVLAGAACASDGFIPDASHIHGVDGLGGATRTLDPALLLRIAEEDVPRLVNAPPPEAGAVTLIGIGPATNIPDLVAWYGRAAVQRIVLMSGAFFDIGNTTPDAEFNAYADPARLQATLDLGIPTLLVPLDVCRKVQLSRAMVASYGDRHPSLLAQLIAASHMRYMDSYRKWEGIDGCFPHDAITVLAALEPARFRRLSGRVTVNCSAAARGRTTIALDETSRVEIATGGDLRWVREAIGAVLT
jgi:inosine-uridine nucleoside N-ribohydrolase